MSDYIEDRVESLEQELENLKSIVRELGKVCNAKAIDHSDYCKERNVQAEKTNDEYNKKFKDKNKFIYHCFCTASSFNCLMGL